MAQSTRDRDAMLLRNFRAFQKMLPELLPEQEDKLALIRDEKLVKVFDTVQEAFAYAKAHYNDKNYNIQPITDEVVDLGSLAVKVSTVGAA